jgi:hypothetical protein
MTSKPQKAETIAANGTNLYYKTFGDQKNPAVLLIMGISWHWFSPIESRKHYS